MNIDDVTLAAQARAGDAAAMREFVVRFRWIVESYAANYARKCRAFDREDLEQAGMVGLLRAVQLFDPKRGPLKPFLCLAARHSIIASIDTNMRFLKRRREIDYVHFAEAVGNQRGTTTVLDSIGDREEVERIRGILPPRWFQAAWMRHGEDRALTEVGKVLGVSRERVRQLCTAAAAAAREGRED